jgi:hypothetical protein
MKEKQDGSSWVNSRLPMTDELPRQNNEAFLFYAQLKEYLTVLLENGLLEYEMKVICRTYTFFADV